MQDAAAAGGLPTVAGRSGCRGCGSGHLPHSHLAALVAGNQQLAAACCQCAHRVVVAQQRLGSRQDERGVPSAHQLRRVAQVAGEEGG